jgi:hypothetical protein
VDSNVVLSLSPNLQTGRLNVVHNLRSALQFAIYALRFDRFFERSSEFGFFFWHPFGVIDSASARRIARVIHPTTEVLYVLPGRQSRAICTVVVRRKTLFRLQIDVGNNEMKLRAVMISMLYPDRTKPVYVHPRSQKLALKTVDQLETHLGRLRQCKNFIFGKTQHSRRISLRKTQRVDQRCCHLRVATKQLRGTLSELIFVVLVGQQVLDCRTAGAATVLHDLR